MQEVTLLQLLHFFFFNDTATTEIYTLSLHDALPIYAILGRFDQDRSRPIPIIKPKLARRSEEHTSELQSRLHLVCRLLLETTTKSLINPRANRDKIVQCRAHYDDCLA